MSPKNEPLRLEAPGDERTDELNLSCSSRLSTRTGHVCSGVAMLRSHDGTKLTQEVLPYLTRAPSVEPSTMDAGALMDERARLMARVRALEDQNRQMVQQAAGFQPRRSRPSSPAARPPRRTLSPPGRPWSPPAGTPTSSFGGAQPRFTATSPSPRSSELYGVVLTGSPRFTSPRRSPRSTTPTMPTMSQPPPARAPKPRAGGELRAAHAAAVEQLIQMEAELAHADRGPALSPVASAAASLSPATRVRLTTLIKRATEAGATEEQLEQAEDEADHRGGAGCTDRGARGSVQPSLWLCARFPVDGAISAEDHGAHQAGHRGWRVAGGCRAGGGLGRLQGHSSGADR